MQVAQDGLFRYTISRGVELMVDPMPRSSGVAIGLWFNVGSAYERENERGLSHFVEHMVFKGAGDRSGQELSRAVDRVGGYLNAFTERETVCLHCLMPSEHAMLAIEILLDMAYRPKFRKAEFEREKDVICNEIMAAEDDLEESSQDEFFAMLYHGHPMERRIAGRVVDIQSIGFESLVSFHDNRFAQGPVTISVAGGVDPELVANYISTYLSGISGTQTIFWNPGPAPNIRERRIVKASGSQVFFYSGIAIEDYVNEDVFWRMTVASSAYGESMSSRLFIRLREELGLCYNVSSSYNLSMMSNLWGVFGATSPAQFPRFASAYIEEATSLYEDGLTELEVVEAVSRIKGLLELASDDPEYRMKRMARQFMYESDTESIGTTIARFAPGGNIDAGTVNQIINKSFDPAKESLLIYGKLSRKVLHAGATCFGANLSDPVETGITLEKNDG
jgi:predicted Zn-dependent peptidase